MSVRGVGGRQISVRTPTPWTSSTGPFVGSLGPRTRMRLQGTPSATSSAMSSSVCAAAVVNRRFPPPGLKDSHRAPRNRPPKRPSASTRWAGSTRNVVIWTAKSAGSTCRMPVATRSSPASSTSFAGVGGTWPARMCVNSVVVSLQTSKPGSSLTSL